MGEIVDISQKLISVDNEKEAEFIGMVKAIAFCDEQTKIKSVRQVYKLANSENRVFLNNFLRKNPRIAAKYGLDTYSIEKSAN